MATAKKGLPVEKIQSPHGDPPVTVWNWKTGDHAVYTAPPRLAVRLAQAHFTDGRWLTPSDRHFERLYPESEVSHSPSNIAEYEGWFVQRPLKP